MNYLNRALAYLEQFNYVLVKIACALAFGLVCAALLSCSSDEPAQLAPVEPPAAPPVPEYECPDIECPDPPPPVECPALPEPPECPDPVECPELVPQECPEPVSGTIFAAAVECDGHWENVAGDRLVTIGQLSDRVGRLLSILGRIYEERDEAADAGAGDAS